MKKVIIRIDFPGMSAKKYDQVWRDLKALGHTNPCGLIHHFGAPSAKGWTVIDIWESADHFNEFSKKLVPLLVKNEVPPAIPIVLPLHYMYNVGVEAASHA